ncbi:hypothetical protein E3N88_34909 [Mikania micrantha]|uniref:Uncharacterized protein n=1 Tax=Mikania micrantha TaxID=192012 RepID=A0A5N6LZG7_9ASTR|nr:hypothetical protein E3N88_34909 [Mikania micrantha]
MQFKVDSIENARGKKNTAGDLWGCDVYEDSKASKTLERPYRKNCITYHLDPIITLNKEEKDEDAEQKKKTTVSLLPSPVMSSSSSVIRLLADCDASHIYERFGFLSHLATGSYHGQMNRISGAGSFYYC